MGEIYHYIRSSLGFVGHQSSLARLASQIPKTIVTPSAAVWDPSITLDSLAFHLGPNFYLNHPTIIVGSYTWVNLSNTCWCLHPNVTPLVGDKVTHLPGAVPSGSIDKDNPAYSLAALSLTSCMHNHTKLRGNDKVRNDLFLSSKSRRHCRNDSLFRCSHNNHLHIFVCSIYSPVTHADIVTWQIFTQVSEVTRKKLDMASKDGDVRVLLCNLQRGLDFTT